MMGAYQFVLRERERERAGKTAEATENEEIKAAYLRGVSNWLHYECMVNGSC